MPDYVAMARDAARRAGIDPDVFVRQIRQESGFAQDVIDGRRRSSAGALGIAQFMPDTARGLGVDPLDPPAALNAAASWMASLVERYGSYALALAAYNAGPGNVERYGGIPPFDETRAYVASILGPTTAYAAEGEDQPTVRAYRGGTGWAREIDPNAPGLESQQAGGAGVDTYGDRPSSEFEPPSRAATAPPPPGAPSQRRFDQVLAAKGDPVSITPLDPEVETEAPEVNFLGKPTGKNVKTKTPNPAPTYRYVFWDGTTLEARTPPGGGAVEIRGGTALGSVAQAQQPQAVTTPADQQYIVTRMPDGSLRREPNPNYVAPAASATKPPGTILGGQTPNEQYIVTVNPDGTVSQSPNPNYVPPRGAGRTTHVVGGRLYTLDADGTVVASQDLRTPEEIAKGQLDLAKGRIDLQKAQRDLLPARVQVVQGLHDTITQLQGMYERGQIELPEMNAYVELAKQAADAELRGTTPAEEAAARSRAKQADQALGMNLLNQRLVTGAGLANTLMQSALGPNVMLRPGQTSLGVDPLADLPALLTQLGGGADIPGYARGLLMGAQGPPPPPTGPAPAGL